MRQRDEVASALQTRSYPRAGLPGGVPRLWEPTRLGGRLRVMPGLWLGPVRLTLRGDAVATR